MDSTPDTTTLDGLAAGRDAFGRFRPGHSGNPAGKKPGTRHMSTIARESLGEDEARRLMRVTIEAGLEGSVGSARWVLDRAFPRARGRDIDLGLPPGATVADAVDAVLAALVSGEITPDEAGQYLKSLDRRGGDHRIGGTAGHATADAGAVAAAPPKPDRAPDGEPAPARPVAAGPAPTRPAPTRPAAATPARPAAAPARPAAPVLPMNRAQRRAAAAEARRAGRPEPAFHLHSPGPGDGAAPSAAAAAAG